MRSQTARDAEPLAFWQIPRNVTTWSGMGQMREKRSTAGTLLSSRHSTPASREVGLFDHASDKIDPMTLDYEVLRPSLFAI